MQCTYFGTHSQGQELNFLSQGNYGFWRATAKVRTRAVKVAEGQNQPLANCLASSVAWQRIESQTDRQMSRTMGSLIE